MAMSALDKLRAIPAEEMKPQMENSRHWKPQPPLPQSAEQYTPSPPEIEGKIVGWHEFPYTFTPDNGEPFEKMVKVMLLDDGSVDDDGEPLYWAIIGFQTVIRDILDSYNLQDLVDHEVDGRWVFLGYRAKSATAMKKSKGATFLDFGFMAAYDPPDGGDGIVIPAPNKSQFVHWDEGTGAFVTDRKDANGQASTNGYHDAPVSAPLVDTPAPSMPLPGALASHAKERPAPQTASEAVPANEAQKARLDAAFSALRSAIGKGMPFYKAYMANLYNPDSNPGGVRALSQVTTQGHLNQLVEFVYETLSENIDAASAWLEWARANPASAEVDPVTAQLEEDFAPNDEPAPSEDVSDEPF